MIIKKPSIYIYTDRPDTAVLKDICAGIEEEGIFFEIKDAESASVEDLAWNAANDSMLGSGIGISGLAAALQMKGIQKEKPVEAYNSPDKSQCRKLGANAARAIKKTAFK